MGQDIVINASQVIYALLVFINLICMLVGGIVLWIARGAIGKLNELEKAHNELRQDLPIEYVRKEDYSADIAEIKAMLRRLFDVMDRKADKVG